MFGDDDVPAASLSLDVKESEYLEMEQRLRGDFSLDSEMVDGEGYTLMDSLADDRMNQEELLAENQSAAILEREVSQAVSRLNEKERFVIEHRVSAEDPMTLQEIADHFSLSRERVRQIEEGALKKMKTLLLPVVSQGGSSTSPSFA